MTEPVLPRYRHEVAISAGLMDARGGSLASHAPRVVSRGDPVRVGMMARLDPIKNQRLVIDAFRLMLESYPSGAGIRRQRRRDGEA